MEADKELDEFLAILSLVSAKTGLGINQMMSKQNRNYGHCVARHMVRYILREMGWTYKHIAELTSCSDYSAAIHSVARMRDLVATEKYYAAVVVEILTEVRKNA